jgi:hypothetical protein
MNQNIEAVALGAVIVAAMLIYALKWTIAINAISWLLNRYFRAEANRQAWLRMEEEWTVAVAEARHRLQLREANLLIRTCPRQVIHSRN